MKSKIISGLFVSVSVIFLNACSSNEAKKADNKSAEDTLSTSETQPEEKPSLPEDTITVNTVEAGMADPNASERGAILYQNYCITCHGRLGEGAVGSNLTDEYWLHGGKDEDIARAIKDGVPSKGMVGWDGQFSQTQIGYLVQFVKSLQGTNPPNAKESQGVKEE